MEYSGGFLRKMRRSMGKGIGAYLTTGIAGLSAAGCSNDSYRNNLPTGMTQIPQATAQASESPAANSSPPPTANYHAAAPNLLGDIASQFVPGPPTPSQFNRPAYGVIERVDCEFGFILGWALDPDNKNVPIVVHVYKNGPAGSPEGVLVGGYLADMPRKDRGRHGFRLDIFKDASLRMAFKTGKAYTLVVHAIDIQGWPNQPLYDKGKYISWNGWEMPGKTLVCLPEE